MNAFFRISNCVPLYFLLIAAGLVEAQPESRGRLAAPVDSRSSFKADYLVPLLNHGKTTLANLLSYERIFVRGNYHLSEKEILRAAGLEGQSLPRFRTVSAITKGVGRLPWIERCQVSWKLLPLRLEIEVAEAHPWMVANFRGHTWLVSSSGALIEPLSRIKDAELVVRASELPRLENVEAAAALAGAASVDDYFQGAIRTLQFLEMAGGLPYEVERYLLQSDRSMRLVAYRVEIPEVVLRAQSLDEAESALTRLSAVFSDINQRFQAQAQGKGASSDNAGDRPPREVDLRFQGQAILR